ncbi:condensation domain-containing protein, partial [Mycolicibacterium pyrenivorans]|uniref:condensation domain-containing protein n=1 Tax=Mycolicibacterium pyrenivorans TaxID=187102 RepID=UPI00355708EF|nr:non-ribosomal peptide synthetase [Mycolicibacterium pyrenivorans]
GDSILSMQVVAQARAAGLTCRPKDIFIEQTVARLAQVADVAETISGTVDEGIGDVVPTPIMRWLSTIDGPTDQFNQSVVVQAPPGVTEADVVVLLQALLDRHGMLRVRADGVRLQVPEPGAVDAAECLRSVESLSEETLAGARSRLNPAAAAMVSALWARQSGQLALIVHHLAIDAVSWRILLEDLNIAWAQHHNGQSIALPPVGTSFRRWASLLAERAQTLAVIADAQAWVEVQSAPAALPAPLPEVDTYASAGRLTASLGPETTRRLLGEVPAAFHAGISCILLIAFALAVTEFLGNGKDPIGIDVEGHGRDEDISPGVDLSRTVGWFTTKYPVAIKVGGLRWAQVVTGDPALGAVIKSAKEQLRDQPDGITYGLLRYLNPEVSLTGLDPSIGFNYLGRMGSSATGLLNELWRPDDAGASLAETATAIPMPLGHTVELNAATLDGGAGPELNTTWIWATSVLDREQISRLSALWLDAVAGICAHVEQGGGGLTPSDIIPARLTQPQLDELRQREPVADVLPLTPMQQGLLFHANTARAIGNLSDLYAMQLEFTITGPLDTDRLHDAVSAVIRRHPNLAARFSDVYDLPVQIIPADPVIPWQHVESDDDVRIGDLCAAERAAVCDLSAAPAIRVALIRTAPERFRVVLTNHHIVLDGWSLPILL